MKRRFSILPREQWLGLGFLTFIIATVMIFVHVVPQQPLPAPELTAIDSLATDSLVYRSTFVRYRRDMVAIHLQPFDPNTADSLTLRALGLKGWQVHNLLRYRERGGRYRRPTDMKRLYGMTDSLYAVLEPYIEIAPVAMDSVAVHDSLPLYVSTKRDTILELNSTDTAELQLLRGIGRYTAVRIIRYREQLGGYASPEQLREIDDLPESTVLDSILPHLTAAADSIRPLYVNRAKVETLMHHPYLSYTQAEAIYRLRRSRTRLTSVDELRALPSMDEPTLRRLIPYLCFE